MPASLFFNLGRLNYSEALDFQRRLVSQKQKEKLPELLLLLEHNHVITFGREGKDENLLSDPKSLEQAGVETHYIERGGDVTYHGPGQLVVYPIFDLRLRGKDVHLFLRNLEEVISGGKKNCRHRSSRQEVDNFPRAGIKRQHRLKLFPFHSPLRTNRQTGDLYAGTFGSRGRHP
jgi:lipoyl(octanoyl) transferase